MDVAVDEFEVDEVGAVDQGLDSEEEFRDRPSEQYAPSNWRGKLIVVRAPSEDLLLVFEGIGVASFGNVEVEINANGVRNVETELANDVGILSYSEVKKFVENEDMLDVAVAEPLEVSFGGIEFEPKIVESLFEMREDGLEFFIVAGDDRNIVCLDNDSRVWTSCWVFDVLDYTSH